ncbi:nucleoside hydrolase [Ornithinibacillus halophilus]|uniref:Purine nucleosidase n=1 Tax=Ornithinibacillus halophilus TaxID=930117 RepID=A0A1M5F394_9BACI|nr:nucleoside hydrolase [Ornithinibacillus halophilus]SHF85838.1 purine nucleosidase [Ornithinibacillus halophilus]
MTQKVLLFGDVGIDDTIALIYAYFNDDIDIIGVVADYGNIPRENAVANTNYVRSLFETGEVEDISVFLGAKYPMTSDSVEYPTEIHGEYGLGPIIPPETANDEADFENFDGVIEIIKKYKDELVIVNIGRLTSLATLFLVSPNLVNEVKGIYVMGGAFWVPGNVTAVSEANFHGDPVAAQIVLTYGENVTIIPLNVTERAIATPQMVDYIDKNNPITIIKTILDFYYDFYKKRNPNVQGSPLHDVVTLMAVENAGLFVYRKLPVHIVQATKGTERGQSIADIRGFGSLQEETEKEIKKHRIAFDFDYKKFYIKFMTTMTGNSFE